MVDIAVCDRTTLIPTAGAAVRAALVAVGIFLLAVGSVLAHSDHPSGHDGGGSVLLPTVILLGSLAVIATGVYLDHTDAVDGRFARLAVLLGVGGVLVGILAAV